MMIDTFTASGLSRIDFMNSEKEPERLFYGVDRKGEFAVLLKDARKDKENNPNYETIVTLRRDLESGWWVSPRWLKLNVGRGGSKLGVKDEEELEAVFLDSEESYAITKAAYKFNQRETVD